MKTQTNISNFKKLSLTVFSALVMTTGSIFAEGPNAYLVNLDAFMNKQEKMIRYTPNDRTESSDVEQAFERLDMLVSQSEASLMYKAPETDETTAATEALERLDTLIASTQESILYQAPTTDQTAEANAGIERLDVLVSATEEALRYKAPVAPESDFTENNSALNELVAVTK